MKNESPACAGLPLQGRQDLNLQPPVLETGALPIELRPSAIRPWDCTRALLGTVLAMDEQELGQGQDDPREAGGQAGDTGDTSAETGAGERGAGTNDLLRTQAGKGYGEDEGERGESLDGE